MTLEFYKKRMAELGIERAALDGEFPPESRASIRELHQSLYMPGHEPKSREKSREKYSKKKIAP